MNSMTCDEVKIHLSAYADQEVDLAMAESLAAHLSVCERCASKFRAMAAVGSLMAKAMALPNSPDLVESVRKHLPWWWVGWRATFRRVATLKGFIPIGAMALLALWGTTQLNAVTGEIETLMTQYRLQAAVQSLERYKQLTGRYPDQVNQVVRPAGLLKVVKADRLVLVSCPLRDGWGHPWVYSLSKKWKFFNLYSKGPNGKDDGGEIDDILVGK